MTIAPADPSLVERFRRDAVAASWNMIEPNDRFGVAVSGGADSLALLLLANAAFPARVAAISIDHGLRPEAAAECAFVAMVCARLDVQHETIAVEVTAAGEGLQSAARQARREAFGTWCQRYPAAWMMTGHHADDQAETVLMRLARGSGVRGLSGMRSHGALPFDPDRLPADHAPSRALLLRPLLGWRRAELATVVRAAGLHALVDPSNADARYDRTRFRALLASTDLLDASRIATTADACADADLALGWAASTFARTAVRKEAERVELAFAPLRPWHVEIMRRILLDIFRHLGVYSEPRNAQFVRLLGLLVSGRPATLAGIKATPGPDVWTFAPAPPRRPTRAKSGTDRSD